MDERERGHVPEDGRRDDRIGPDPLDPADDGDKPVDDVDRAHVEAERDQLKEFVAQLSGDDIKTGGWFTKLLSLALASYTKKVDWQYFQERYEGVPADAIVDQRIKMAARYAAIGGGLSASAYTGAIALTIGSLGGASPATVPAAVATVMVDVAYISQLQIRLAYDIAVLYRIPLDTSDPDDLWKLIRVAFTIRAGEVAREGALKVVPAVMRPLIKRFFSGPVLAAARGLPVVGKFLLQRNVIKIGIPLVGIPLAVAVNRYSTLVAGRHARLVFRNEARVIEVASTLSDRSRHPNLLLWVGWLVIMADDKIADDEALLFRHLVKLVRDRHEIVDEQLSAVVELDPDEVWRRVDETTGDLSDLLDAARRVAEIDGPINDLERAVVIQLEGRCKAS